MIVGKFDEINYVSKGWGGERWLWNDNGYCGKELFIAKGKKCSWHYHKVKDEVFYILEGELSVSYGWDDNRDKAETVTLVKGNLFHVPTGLRHQMFGVQDTRFIEFSTIHSDEDSIRVIRGD